MLSGNPGLFFPQNNDNKVPFRFIVTFFLLHTGNKQENNSRTIFLFWSLYENLKKEPLAKYGIRSTGGILDIKKKADNPPGYPEHS